jgi:hAT family protein
MDYLPIQASSVPCEHVFSSAGETDTKRRNHIAPALMEALQILKFIYKKDRLNFTAGFKTDSEPVDPDNSRDLLAELFEQEDPRDATDRLLNVLGADDSGGNTSDDSNAGDK